jgi:glycosyltransferase involved in cell wall biosynthesis
MMRGLQDFGEVGFKVKVVLLHDWLTGFRGGERVFEVFCELFPQAPIYTLIHKPHSTSALIESHPIYTSFLQSIPGITQHYRKFLPLFPRAAESLKIIEDADLVLSSSHCVIKGVQKPKGAFHLSYIHSPMRYLYDQYDNYFGPGAPLYQRIGARVFKNSLVNWDKKSNANVDLMVANASFVQERIKKYYDRESTVVHPFVDLEDFEATKDQAPEKQDYYLVLSAFAPNKRVDLAVQAFSELKLPLRVIGSGQLEKELKTMAGETVEFLGNISREQVIEQLSGARALIFPGVEDFGITPLEALASGTPVIAYKAGGVLETLNNEVAEFFDTANVEALKEAVLLSQKRTFSHQKMRQRAEGFSKEIFKEKILKLIEQHVQVKE